VIRRSCAMLHEPAHMEVMVLYRETTIEQYIRLRETGNVGYLDFDIEELRSLPLDTVRRIAYDFLPLLQHNPYADYDLIPQTILEAMALYCDIDEELVRKLARTGDDGICTSLCWNKRVLLSTRRSIADHGSETVRGHFIYGELYDEIHDEHTSPERLREIFFSHPEEYNSDVRDALVQRRDIPGDVVEAALHDPVKIVRDGVLLRDAYQFLSAKATDGPLPGSVPTMVREALRRFARQVCQGNPKACVYVLSPVPEDARPVLEVLGVGIRRRVGRRYEPELSEALSQHWGGRCLETRYVFHPRTAARFRNATGQPKWNSARGMFERQCGAGMRLFLRVDAQRTSGPCAHSHRRQCDSGEAQA